MGIEEKLDVISLHEKGEWIVDICHNVTLHFIIMLIEFQKVQSQELKCLC